MAGSGQVMRQWGHLPWYQELRASLLAGGCVLGIKWRNTAVPGGGGRLLVGGWTVASGSDPTVWDSLTAQDTHQALPSLLLGCERGGTWAQD